MKVNAYAAQSAGTPLAPFTYEARTPRENDVVIDILYCGVCHSDLHTVNGDWQAKFPVVPGHEIVGRVREVGKSVKKYAVGDLVAVGCMVDSCQHCAPCERSEEQYCENGMTPTYNSTDRIDGTPTYGGYADSITVREEFVLRIPEGIDLKTAAPILCAGVTTWSPLRHWNVGAGSKVAVVGLGGLGHMAIKLAHALGAEVSLFSRSPNKAEEAQRLGADKVVISTDEAQMAEVAGYFDVILNTVPYEHEVRPYMKTLTSGGAMVMLGYMGTLPDVVSGDLVFSRRSLAGSLIGGIRETQEVLDFCAKHGIGADVELINIQDINQAYGRMVKSDVHYRFVIDMASLKESV